MDGAKFVEYQTHKIKDCQRLKLNRSLGFCKGPGQIWERREKDKLDLEDHNKQKNGMDETKNICVVKVYTSCRI